MNTSRLFFILGSIFIPLFFGIVIPLLLKTNFKVNAFWVGLAFLVCAAMPRVIRDALFYPINKIAMFIGHINQTIIMGFIFYGMFAPISIFRKMKGSDPMGLKQKGKTSFWREPDEKWINFDRPY